MSKRTITCPMGCHEDFLEREYESHYAGMETWWNVTRYVCRKCEWEAEWNTRNGLIQTSPPFFGNYDI